MFNYSYVDVAVDKYSYCTLFYNRLGVADLSHANPIMAIQAPIAVNVLIRSIPCFDRALFPSSSTPSTSLAVLSIWAAPLDLS